MDLDLFSNLSIKAAVARLALFNKLIQRYLSRDSWVESGFQSSYCAKARAERKKKVGTGRGRGEEETFARQPHDFEKRPLIFHGSVRL